MEQVSGYRDLHRIGQGGFSVVYRARQEEIGRDVALKILAVEFIDGRILRQFLREVQLTAKLTGHPNVVTVLDSGLTVSGRPYIAMDFYDRGSLRDRLRADGPLPVREVLRAGVKIAAVLEAAHREGFLHRDVKPQNILVSRFGEPALGDFGTARLTAALDATSHTEALTPVHAAPEILQGRVPDARADLYSLGSTLYQLLDGRPAFEREAEPGIAPLLLRVLTEPVPPMTRAEVPDAVQAVIAKAMAREPGERFASGGEFAAALQDVQAALGLAVTETPEDAARGIASVPAPSGAEETTSEVTGPAVSVAEATPTVETLAPLPAIVAPAVTSPTETSPTITSPVAAAADPPLAVTPWSSSETVGDWKAALPPDAPGAKPSPAAALAGIPSARVPLPRTLRLPWYESRPRVLRAVTVATGTVVALGGVTAALALSSGGAKSATPPQATAPRPGSPTTAPASAPPTQQQQPASVPAPSAVAAKTAFATVTLTWTLPPADAQSAVMIVPSPNPGGLPMVPAGTGVTSYQFHGLDQKTRYCFKVGIYAGYTSDGTAIFSWADPVCADG